MKYHIIFGGWLEANFYLKEKGGMLFDSKHPRGNKTLTSGNNTYYFWEHLDGLYKDIQLLGTQLGYEEDDKEFLTMGKLARWYLKSKIALPYKGTFWDKSAIKQARLGTHWHYLYAKPGEYAETIELDIKSAYATSLLSQKSLLYSDRIGYMRDDGAIERMRKDIDTLPKKFRLILLGILAQYQLKFYIKDKTKEEFELKYCEKFKIEWGAGFNAVHRAILRIYNLMKVCHNILGESVIRIHTDSFLIDINHTDFINNKQQFFDTIKRTQLELTCKCAGKALIKDVGTLIIGTSLKGSKHELIKYMAQNKNKLPRNKPQLERYGNILLEVSSFKEGIFSDD